MTYVDVSLVVRVWLCCWCWWLLGVLSWSGKKPYNTNESASHRYIDIDLKSIDAQLLWTGETPRLPKKSDNECTIHLLNIVHESRTQTSNSTCSGDRISVEVNSLLQITIPRNVSKDGSSRKYGIANDVENAGVYFCSQDFNNLTNFLSVVVIIKEINCNAHGCTVEYFGHIKPGFYCESNSIRTTVHPNSDAQPNPNPNANPNLTPNSSPNLNFDLNFDPNMGTYPTKNSLFNEKHSSISYTNPEPHSKINSVVNPNPNLNLEVKPITNSNPNLSHNPQRNSDPNTEKKIGSMSKNRIIISDNIRYWRMDGGDGVVHDCLIYLRCPLPNESLAEKLQSVRSNATFEGSEVVTESDLCSFGRMAIIITIIIIIIAVISIIIIIIAVTTFKKRRCVVDETYYTRPIKKVYVPVHVGGHDDDDEDDDDEEESNLDLMKVLQRNNNNNSNCSSSSNNNNNNNNSSNSCISSNNNNNNNSSSNSCGNPKYNNDRNSQCRTQNTNQSNKCQCRKESDVITNNLERTLIVKNNYVNVINENSVNDDSNSNNNNSNNNNNKTNINNSNNNNHNHNSTINTNNNNTSSNNTTNNNNHNHHPYSFNNINGMDVYYNSDQHNNLLPTFNQACPLYSEPIPKRHNINNNDNNNNNNNSSIINNNNSSNNNNNNNSNHNNNNNNNSKNNSNNNNNIINNSNKNNSINNNNNNSNNNNNNNNSNDISVDVNNLDIDSDSSCSNSSFSNVSSS